MTTSRTPAAPDQSATRRCRPGKKTHSATGRTFLHTDTLGSPVATTDASGTIVGRTRYEPYGKTAAGTDPRGIGFTGQLNDPDTGLVYMQQRYYDPLAGRFLSVDPVTTDAATGAGFNLYGYAKDNPYRFTDPDGRLPLTGDCPGAPSECSGIGEVGGFKSKERNRIAKGASFGFALGVAAEVGCAASSGGACVVATPWIVGGFTTLGGVSGYSVGKLADWLSGLTLNGVDSTGSNVRDNRSKGQKAEGEVATDLEGAGRDVDRQVRKDTPFGPRVIDVEVKDKNGNVLGGVEVKVGTSRYRPDQRSKDEWLRQNGYPVNVVRKP